MTSNPPLPTRLRSLIAWATEQDSEPPKFAASFLADEGFARSPLTLGLNVVWWSSTETADAVCFDGTCVVTGLPMRRVLLATWNGDEVQRLVSVGQQWAAQEAVDPAHVSSCVDGGAVDAGIPLSQARALAAALGYPLVENRHREGPTWWFFPVHQIGCAGIVVDRASGSLTKLGSAGNLDDWLWGYEQNIVRNDALGTDLVVTQIGHLATAAAALASVGTCGGDVWWTRERLAVLPAKFAMSWTLIHHAEKLRAFSPLLFVWHAEPSQDGGR